MNGIRAYWRAVFVDSWGRVRELTDWTNYAFANDVALAHGERAFLQRIPGGETRRSSW